VTDQTIVYSKGTKTNGNYS